MSPATTPGPERLELPITRDDLRLVRGAGREEPQPARRRRGVGQLRHRDGRGGVRPGRRRPPSAWSRPSSRPGYGARLPAGGAPPAEEADEPDPSRRAAPPPRRLGRPLAAGAADVDDPGAAVRQLAVAGAAARDAGRALGRLALPPRGLAQPAPRRGHDGHPDLGRHARRLGLVAGRPVLPRRRRSRHADGLRPGRSSRAPAADHIYLEVAAVVTTFILAGRYFEVRAKRRAGRRAARPARAGRQGGLGARRRRRRAAGADRRARRSATASSCARASGSPPTASSRRAPPPSTRRCSPARACRWRSARATRSPGPRSTPAGAWWCGPPGSARTRRSPRSAGW